MARYRAVPRRTTAAPKPEQPAAEDLNDRLKPELVELAEARGIDSSGTKAEIIERLSKP